MPAVFVYSDDYYADLGPHVFPVGKYRLVYRELQRLGILGPNLLEPTPASQADLLLVHEPEYVEDLIEARWTPRTAPSEMPISREIIQAFLLATGGTILACEKAMESGCAINLGAGFHHAFPDHGEGFCYINDMAVGIRRLQAQKGNLRVAVIDCDLHQGNGTAFVFKDDESVFTFSIHQRDIYPAKEDSNWDIHLRDGVGDEEYLSTLRQAVPSILEKFRPGFVLYQAGADPYEQDQLGHLCLTLEGLKARDEMVFGECYKSGIPVATVLGGGYALNTSDTVTIHVNTCLAAIDRFG